VSGERFIKGGINALDPKAETKTPPFGGAFITIRANSYMNWVGEIFLRYLIQNIFDLLLFKINTKNYSFVRIWGNNITSLIEAESVNNITNRSIPIPSPAVGGIPYSSAVI
jgi:hypothetical protein